MEMGRGVEEEEFSVTLRCLISGAYRFGFPAMPPRLEGVGDGLSVSPPSSADMIIRRPAEEPELQLQRLPYDGSATAAKLLPSVVQNELQFSFTDTAEAQGETSIGLSQQGDHFPPHSPRSRPCLKEGLLKQFVPSCCTGATVQPAHSISLVDSGSS